MPTKISARGQISLPAGLRKKYGIKAGCEVEILDFGGEIVIVPVPETKGRGFLKFKKRLDELIAEYKREENEMEMKR